MVMPRAFSIILGRDSHSLLMPLFLGMTMGLTIRYLLIWKKNITTSHKKINRKNTADFFIKCMFFWFIILTLRSLIDYYSPFVLFGYPIQDLETGYRVSSNYSMYLTSMVSIGFLGPLIFVMMDFEYRKAISLRINNEKASIKIAEELITGFAVGTLMALIVIIFQETGIKRLFAGVEKVFLLEDLLDYSLTPVLLRFSYL